MRPISTEELCHERLGDEFERALSHYDTQRRVEILIDDFFSDDMIRGKAVLDVGCGLGFFSQRLSERGAKVYACDIGPGLVEKTRDRVGCEACVADVLNLVGQFGPEHFDVVVSSECIEHVPDPGEALRQMIGVLRPGGYIAVSTPNKVWYPVVRLATVLKLRPFDGHEHFSTWRSIKRTLEKENVEIVKEFGLHLFPFQLPAHGLSRWCDKYFQAVRRLMINICILGRKCLSNRLGEVRRSSL